MQTSKTVYFSDYPSKGSHTSGLTIPFGAEDLELYEFVRPLSSHSVRRLIGHQKYSDIAANAAKANTHVATYVRQLLHKKAPTYTKGDEGKFLRLQSTFRGGRGSPLHEWYPYLEGYSPDFVSNIIDTFAPKARDIFDPFCGSGTTALVSAMRGGVGYYSEVNPACRYVIEAKALALTLSSKTRSRLASALYELGQKITSSIGKCKPDENLSRSFLTAFGDRHFFEEHTYQMILRARTYANKIERSDPVLGKLLIVALLRCLVPCSLLVRRGDLRFMTPKELSRGVPDFCKELTASLELIASDLLDSESVAGRTQFVCSDARDAHQLLPTKVDAIVTSPPYLNGTNYFRNTKIELWFLGHLSSKADLRGFRDDAITSGINDVTKSKLNDARNVATRFQSNLLKQTLEVLNEAAYDMRIPAMVENYFYDMHDVLATLPNVLNDDGVIAIDLGDSMYSGVHVATQDILSEMLEDSGFNLRQTVVLRERQSRGGTRLNQTLQVFSPKSKMRKEKWATTEFERYSEWNKFKNTFPHQQGEMAKRNWGHSWHSMCSYQGKLKPSIARCLVDALMPSKGGRLLDTFSGVGTIPFEARLCGHTAFGFDISPAAVAISRAKLQPIDWDEVDNLVGRLETKIKRDRSKYDSFESLELIRFNGPLPSYFHEDTLREILASRAYFQKHGFETGASALVFASLLHILHGNRPYALSRRSHPITPFAPTGPTEYRDLMSRLRNKIERLRKDADEVPKIEGHSFCQDVTEKWPDVVHDLDAIITSPPFFDSTRFHTANWMRLWLAGWEPEDFVDRPASFIDERQKESFAIYENIFRQAQQRLKLGGVFAIHVGKSKKCDMAAELQEIGERFLSFQDWFAESVEHCESHGIRDKGTVTHHQYLLFEKVNL
ncbi:DNA methyltransferase [Pseudahrensia aquimaris]|uniref:site-specific DNA-methyltransferase (adenine-specific) n=1 Tax=Pseudahrensia aquimaris TaxID=744461 RepID=A0ABW3F992_9HYPH